MKEPGIARDADASTMSIPSPKSGSCQNKEVPSPGLARRMRPAHIIAASCAVGVVALAASAFLPSFLPAGARRPFDILITLVLSLVALTLAWCFRRFGSVLAQPAPQPFDGERTSFDHDVTDERDLAELARANHELKLEVEALARSESRYRVLFENAADGIYRTSPTGAILSANQALARILGYDTPSELIEQLGIICRDLYIDPARRDRFCRVIAERSQVIGFESQVRRRDATVIWISENAKVVRDERGEPLYYEGFVQDISIRKALDSERERILADALERADRDPLTGLLNHRAFHRHFDEEAERARREGKSLVVAVMDLDNFKFFNDAYGHVAGDEVLREVANVLRQSCRTYDTLGRFGGDEFVMLMPSMRQDEAFEFKTRLYSRLKDAGFRPEGYDATIPLSLSIGIAVYPDEAASRLEVLDLADSRLRRTKTGGTDTDEADRLRSSLTRSMEGFSMLDALVSAVHNKDRYTRRHSEDVMAYSLEIVDEMGYEEEFRRTVAIAALLHDVGKIGVPDHILRKPAALTPDEFEAVKLHPIMGAAIVAAVPGFEETLDAVRYHHERWDGRGYPDGLAGEEAPLIARLMAVADAYSAMTTDRPYRKGMPERKALAIIEEGAGVQWDPVFAQAFLRVRRSGAARSRSQTIKAA